MNRPWTWRKMNYTGATDAARLLEHYREGPQSLSRFPKLRRWPLQECFSGLIWWLHLQTAISQSRMATLICQQNSRLGKRPAHARTVGNYLQVNTFKDGQSFDFCKAECLMDLCESDHVLHLETEQSSKCGDPCACTTVLKNNNSMTQKHRRILEKGDIELK